MIARLAVMLSNHKLDVIILSVLLVIAGTVSSLNMAGYPQRFEDEGTYVSQAYAVEKKHTLSHYTYWYDHPPAGWIQIAGYTTLTKTFDRYSSAISAGREFMLVLHLITIVLLYALARRITIGSIAAGLGTLLYILSPLTIEFSRYVLLDNVALPWLLGAFLLALSPRRSIGAALGSAICMAMAILSKETLFVLLPVLYYVIWQNGDKRNRRFMLTTFCVIFVMVSGSYVLYAVLKNELIPGSGHVSLLGTLAWQLFGRAGSGSVFNPNSATRGLIHYWLSIDPWLLVTGVAALPVSLYVRKLRPVGLALFIGLLMLLRTGYLPYPYIVALLPFAALSIAAALQYLIIAPLQLSKLARPSMTIRFAAAAAAIDLIIVSSIFIAPAWQPKISDLTTKDNDASSRQTVDWVSHNIGHENRLVVESALWTDLEKKGFDQPQPVWLYKTETDPEVTKALGGWRGIDYIILNGPTISQNSSQKFPTVYTAIAHAKIVATFGHDNQKIFVYKVIHSTQLKVS